MTTGPSYTSSSDRFPRAAAAAVAIVFAIEVLVHSQRVRFMDGVFRAADHGAVPIVWCYSDKSGLKFAGLTEHPNVIQLKNLTQEELYYVYDHAMAYLSFSFPGPRPRPRRRQPSRWPRTAARGKPPSRACCSPPSP